VLLQQTDLSVTEIAQQTGFSNVFYFSKMFSKRAGQTPTACRLAPRTRERTRSSFV